VRRMRAGWLVIGLLVAVLGLGAASSPVGTKMTVTAAGLNRVVPEIIPYLVSQMKAFHIDDMEFEVSVPFPIGPVKIGLRNIKLTSLSLASGGVTISPQWRIGVKFSPVTIQVDCDYHFNQEKFPHAAGDGSVMIRAASASMDLVLVFGESQGKPTMSVDALSMNWGDFTLDVSGSLKWLYDLLMDLAPHKILPLIQEKILDALRSAIDTEAQQALAQLSLVIPVDPYVEVDFRIPWAPIFTADHFTVHEKGEFYLIRDPHEAPIGQPPWFPDILDGRSVQVLVSDWTVNTAGYAYLLSGLLAKTITDKDLPPEVPIRLNTTNFCGLLPNLCQHFPKRLMVLKLAETVSPRVQFLQDNARVTLTGQIEVDVVVPPHETMAFVLSVGIGASVKPGIKSTSKGFNITASLFNPTSTVGLLTSNIGTFTQEELDGLRDLFSQLLMPTIVQTLNTVLGYGFPVPIVAGFAFTRPEIYVRPNYLFVGTDLDFSPPHRHV